MNFFERKARAGMVKGDLVERVARAIWDAGDRHGFDWEDAGEAKRQDTFALARAALGAMREPTEAMLVAYAEASWFFPETWRGKAASAWRVMIDAELNAAEDDEDKGWR